MALIAGGEVTVDFEPSSARSSGGGSGVFETVSRAPRRRVTRRVRVEPFFMDRFEVTNADYHRFLQESGYEPHPGTVSDWADGAPSKDELDMPKVFVSFADAQAYAHFYGKRLPTTAEWVLAKEGETGRTYPWGRSFNRNRLNCLETGMFRAWRVGTFESGKSPQGVYDLVGNAAEWTWLSDDPEGMHHIVGGSWRRAMAPEEKPRFIDWSRAREWNSEIGFRCVLDVTPALYDRFLALLDQSESIRLQVMEDLVRLDPVRAVETLAALQNTDEHATVRVRAARQLISLGRQDRVHVGELVRMTGPRFSLEVRDAAIGSISLLEAYGADLPGISRPLLDTLAGIPGERGGSRTGVARAMRDTDPDDAAGDPEISGLEPVTRLQLFRDLARLLVDLEEIGVYEFLVKQARAGKREYQAASAVSLRHLRLLPIDQDKLALDLFEIIRRSDDSEVRRAAFDSIAGLDVETGLIRVLRDLDDVDLRILAAQELEWFAFESSLEALCDVVVDETVPMRVRLTAAYSLLWMNFREVAEDADQGGAVDAGDAGEESPDPWMDAFTMRAIDSIDRTMPTFVAALDHEDERTRVDAAAVVRTFLDRVDIPRLGAAYWLDWRPLADQIGYELRDVLRDLFWLYEGVVYGVHANMEEYVDGDAGELRPWVIERPFYIRARAVGVELTAQAKMALIPVGPKEVAEQILVQRRESAIRSESDDPEKLTVEEIGWVESQLDEIQEYLVLAWRRGFRDLERIRRDDALASFRVRMDEDKDGRKVEVETSQYAEIRELYSR